MKDEENHVIAIDIGASSGRLITFSLKENILHFEETYRFKNSFIHDGDNCIWDMEHIYANILQGLSQNNRLSIKSIGVDTWGVDYVLIGEEGDVIDKIFAYRDNRTNHIYDKVLSEIGREKIYNLTGIELMSINTFYQLKAHLLSNAEVFEKVKYILMIPDYLHYKLSGVFCNEFTEMSTSQLVCHKTKKLNSYLLDYLGLSDRLFPRMVYSGEVLGNLHKSVQIATGLDENVKVIVPGSHDTASALVSSIGDEDTVCICSGTWSLVSVNTDAPIVSADALKYNFSNEGGVYGTNILLKNGMGMWLINNVLSELAPNKTFQQIVEEAKQIESFRTIINSNAQDFVNPSSMVQAIHDYAHKTGQIIPRTIGEFARCIYESLALEYNKTILALEEITHKEYRDINIIGGGGRNKFLNQLTANITKKNVVSGPIETSSIGNAIVQMISLGWISNIKTAREIVKQSVEVMHFYPENVHAQKAVHFFYTLCKESE